MYSEYRMYNKTIALINYLLMGSILLGFVYGISVIGLSVFNSVQESKLALLAAEANIYELKAGASSVFQKEKEAISFYSFKSWGPIVISWAPLIVKYLASLLPTTLLKLPYLGKVFTFIAWATTEASQIPVEPDLIRAALGDITTLAQRYEAIHEATQLISQAHERLGQESLDQKDSLRGIGQELLSLKAKLEITDLRAGDGPILGRGAALPMRSSAGILPEN